MAIFTKKNMVMKISGDDLDDAKLSSVDFINEQTKKRAFINVLGARLAMKMLFSKKIQANNLYSMYTIHSALNQFDIADIYYKNIKIDVRLVFNENEIFVPKSHFEHGLVPDVYLVLSLNPDFSSAELLGFFEPETLDKTNANSGFYFYEKENLQKPDHLKKFLDKFRVKNDLTYSVDEIEKAKDLFIPSIDEEIGAEDKHFLFSQLANNIQLRENFVEFENFEFLSLKVANEETLFRDGVLEIIAGQRFAAEDELIEAEEAENLKGFDNAETLENVCLPEIIEDGEIEFIDDADSIGSEGLSDEIEFLYEDIGDDIEDDIEDDIGDASNDSDYSDFTDLEDLADQSEKPELSKNETENDSRTTLAESALIAGGMVIAGGLTAAGAVGAASLAQSGAMSEAIAGAAIETTGELLNNVSENLINNDPKITDKELAEESQIETTTNEQTEENQEADAKTNADEERIESVEEDFEALDETEEIEDVSEPIDEIEEEFEEEIIEELEITDKTEEIEDVPETIEEIEEELEEESEIIEELDEKTETYEFIDEDEIAFSDADEVLPDLQEDLQPIEEPEDLEIFQDAETIKTNEEPYVELLETHGELAELQELEPLESNENLPEIKITEELETPEENSFEAFESSELMDLDELENKEEFQELSLLDDNSEIENNDKSPAEDGNVVALDDFDFEMFDNHLPEENNDENVVSFDSFITPSPTSEVEHSEEILEPFESENDANLTGETTSNDESEEKPNNDEDVNLITSQIDDLLKEIELTDKHLSFLTSQIDEILQETEQMGLESTPETAPEPLQMMEPSEPEAPSNQPADLYSTQSVRNEEDADLLQSLFKTQDLDMGLEEDTETTETSSAKNKKILITASVAGVMLVSLVAGSIVINNKNANQNANPSQTSSILRPADGTVDAGLSGNIDQSSALAPADNTGMPTTVDNGQPQTVAQPQDMGKALTDAFSTQPVTASISKIAWEVPEDLAYNDSFRKYLQTAGKNLKLTLQNDLLLATEMAYSNRVVVDLTIDRSGTISATKIVASSGSKQIDGIVLQSVKETLNYLKPPSSEISGQSVNATLIINF